MNKETGGPAFPRNGVRLIIPSSLANHPDIEKIEYYQDGMTMWDYYAAASLMGQRAAGDGGRPMEISTLAAMDADAMIAQRKQSLGESK